MKKPYKGIEPGDYTRPGVTATPDGVNFTLATKSNQKAELLLYRKGNSKEPIEVSLGKKVLGDVYSIKLKEFSPEKYEYNYRIGEMILQDPYARRIVRQKGDTSRVRCGFDVEDYDWEGDQPLKIPYEDAILYHLHVRGFTKSPSSKVKKKGTFQGIIEKIDYFKELGINQLLLMPIYDFEDQVPKTNYWGYGKGNYFAPKAAYAAGDPVKEVKDMVKVLHKAGIEVLMELYFTEETDVRTMLLCMEHWVSNYHMDGFCLMGNPAAWETAAKEPLFSETKLLASWFPTERIYRKGETPKYRNLAECNDGFLVDARRFLKSDEGMAGNFRARIQKNPAKCAVINYIAGHDGYTLADLVSYQERHNEKNGEGNQDGPAENFSWNCGEEGPTRKKVIQDFRLHQMKNAVLLVMLSQGTPMLRAGDEFGNSQEGNNNPYCQDNEISWLDWKDRKKNQEFFAFVKEAIAFRKSQRLLHQARELTGTDTAGIGCPDISFHGKEAWYVETDQNSRQFGALYCGGTREETEYLYVAYNFHWRDQELALPRIPEGRKWEPVLTSGETLIYNEQKTIKVAPRTIQVLIGRK